MREIDVVQLDRTRPTRALTREAARDAMTEVAVALGVVTEDVTGAPTGAAWARLASAETAGYGFVADDVPELGMAILVPYLGLGLGSRLLDDSRGFRPVGRVGGSDTLLLRR